MSELQLRQAIATLSELDYEGALYAAELRTDPLRRAMGRLTLAFDSYSIEYHLSARFLAERTWADEVTELGGTYIAGRIESTQPRDARGRFSEGWIVRGSAIRAGQRFGLPPVLEIKDQTVKVNSVTVRVS